MATPNENNVFGGIDFAAVARRDLTRIDGARVAPFQVVVRQSALNRVHYHGDATPRVEICGVLVGDIYQDETGPFLLIEHIIEGQAATGSAGQVTFTAETWQHIQTLMDEKFPTLRIVGWYHTHPGHGIFLSDMDVFLHESFFGLPWQVALVYDPRSGEDGILSAKAGQPRRMEFLTEIDEDPTMTLAQAATSRPITSAMDPGRMPAVRADLKRKSRSIWRFLLVFIGLALFGVVGGLIGLWIRQQRFELPLWIQRMAHG